MKNIKKLLSALTATAMCATVCLNTVGNIGIADAADATATDINSMTATELVDAMGLGTNLGNTFDAWNTGGKVETAWGNLPTTQAMIDGMHNYGFDSLRLPVTWYEHWDSATQTIDDDYIARIKEVIDYCYANDMYVVMDMHWDWESGGSLWLNAGASAEAQFRAMWSDIAESFAEYDRHLAFQSVNEVRWTSGAGSTYTDNDYNILNTLNAAFVEEVRATGGNNADRLLVLGGADANLTNTLNSKYIVPDDDMLAVDVHFYNPSTFCVATQNSTWGYSATWGTDAEKSEIINSMNKLKTRFVDNGVGVIIGEYGVVTAEGKDKDSMLAFLECVAGNALAIEGISAFLWDDGDSGSMEYFSRNKLAFHDADFGTLYTELAGNGYVPPTIDWVETEITIDEDGKQLFQIGNSTRVKLVFECPHSNYPVSRVGGIGSLSYWDTISNTNVNNAISFSFSEDETTGELLANEESEADADGKTTTVQYGYLNIPGTVAPANCYVGVFYAGYNTFTESGDYIGWNEMDSADYPKLVKVYIDGVVEDSGEGETTEPPTEEPSETEIVWGDADCNGEVELNDAVLVMSNVIDSTANPISDQGKINADVYSNGDGISNMDALAIQKYLAQLISELPES